MTITVALIILGFACWISNYIGYRKGYWHGTEDQINKTAARTERMKRFY